jgi:peptidoglycan/xylan/chitin deacetylase (PgdA/CDA1 family)
MRKFLFSITSIFLFCFNSQAKEIALSFDDAPRGSTHFFSGEARTDALISELKRAKVSQAVFFGNSSNFTDQGKKRIQKYIDADHLIANHSHSHPDLNSSDPEEYWENVMLADAHLKKLENFRTWFRFPYLREGKTKEVRDFIRNRMRDAGYRNGYVTVDTGEWYTDDLFQQALRSGKKANLSNLSAAYVKMLVEGVEFYDKIAVDTLGRSPKHILLLHENDLAALFIFDLVTELRRRGWEIISPEQAYADPISQVEPDTLLLNQGRVAAIAKANGYKGSVWSKWEEEEEIENLLTEFRAFE